MINRQCPECGGYEMDDGTSDLCYCYEVGSDEVEKLKADLDRHKRALELALYYVEGDATYEIVKEKVSRILEGGE